MRTPFLKPRPKPEKATEVETNHLPQHLCQVFGCPMMIQSQG